MNFWKREKNHLFEAVGHIRSEIRMKLEEELHKKQETMAMDGKYPYMGLWLNLAQIDIVQKKMKWRTIIVSFEILILFVLMLSLAYGFYRLIIWFSPR